MMQAAARRFSATAAAIAACVTVLFSPSPAFAHPHVFIDASLEFQLSSDACDGILVEWVFDPVFSADLISQFDRNRDGAFDASESSVIQAKAFSNLKKYGYFTFIRQGDRRYVPEAVEGFVASQRGGRAVYRFRVPLSGTGFGADASVAAFDSTFYCDIRYGQVPATVSWAKGVEPRPTTILRAKNEKYPIYYNPVGGAGDTKVYLKWEKGLQTAYPEEIRVRLD